MDDGREALNEIDRALRDEIDAALDVDVSPEFMARVRRRIADEPMRAPFWYGWRLALPAAAAALVLIAAGVSMLPARRPAPVSASRTPIVEPAPPAAERPSPPPAAVTSVATAAVRSAAPRPASAEPDVLVPREEIEMYRRLLARAASAPRPVVVEASDLVPTGTLSEITLDPIRIDRIVPPVGGEGERQ
jgi:hypothetical protein